MSTTALLALEDGSLFTGVSIGAEGVTCGELVFNTAMTGYQEILTDPSYASQIVTLTYPHIGNVGTNDADAESNKPWAAGLVIRDLAMVTSSWRNEMSLRDYLSAHGIVGIAGLDTRQLTNLLREKGAQNACIVAGSQLSEQEAIAKAKAFPGLKGMDLASKVTTASIEQWTQGSGDISNRWQAPDKAFDASVLPYHVVVYDFGVKENILKMLVDRGCRVTRVPATTPASEVIKLSPDGVLLSNGPGDPEPCGYAIEAIKTLLEQSIPLFGICLGYQLLALASGAKTVKMKFGHHGANHPVQSLSDQRVFITSQNHGFAVDEKTLASTLNVTHKSLFDGSLQGIERNDKPAFGFQGHPEASPGPQDVSELFDHFVFMMQEGKASSVSRKV